MDGTPPLKLLLSFPSAKIGKSLEVNKKNQQNVLLIREKNAKGSAKSSSRFPVVRCLVAPHVRDAARASKN